MHFGAVIQTHPPASRTVHLAKLAEQYGFEYVWTFDSHILWEEPYVIYSAILAQTNRVIVGPMVTNPATGARQVPNAEIALCHGNGGVLSSQVTALLGTAATV